MDRVVLIPAFNEELSIGLVLSDLNTLGLSEIIVIDNNSTDKTKDEIIKHNATYLLEKNGGYGSACLKGLDYVFSKYKGEALIGFIDGDYSDHPIEIESLFEKCEHSFDMCIGSRLRGKSEAGALFVHASLGNKFACFMMSLLYPGKFKFSDLGPMRVIKKNKLLEIGMIDKNFGWTIEMQMKALQKDLKISELPVSYKKRIGKSKISGSIIGSLKASIKILYSLYLYY